MAYDPHLKYWSKLESASDVTSPQVGNAGTEDGSPTYAACKFNNGIYVDANAEGYYFANNPQIVSGNKGTVEFWIKPDYDLVNGIPSTATHHVFLDYYPTETGLIRLYIHGTLGISIMRIDDTLTAVPIYDTTTDWTAGDLVHIAFVWDKDAGFDGTKTMAIYVNDVETASLTTTLGAITDDTSNVYVGERVAQVWNMEGVLDNIKIWDIGKTDFSDKDTEEPPTTEEDNALFFGANF